MKRYLCVLLIGCMLLQVSGCSRTVPDPVPAGEGVQETEATQPEDAQTTEDAAETSGEDLPESTGAAVSTAENVDVTQPVSPALSAEPITNLRLHGMEDLGTREMFPVYYYNLFLSEESIALNAAGQLLPASGPQWYALHDVLTGEANYYTCMKLEEADVESSRQYEETDGDGSRQIECYSRLYSADGVMVSDWEPCVYGDCIGNCVIRHDCEWDDYNWELDYVSSCLWDTVNNDVLVDGAQNLKRLNVQAALCEMYDGPDLLIDSSGHVMAVPPEDLSVRYTYAEKGYIFAGVTLDGTDYSAILDENFNVLHTEDENCYYSMNEITVRGDYILVSNYNIPGVRVLDMNDFSTLAVYDTGLEYFDGELAIVGEYQDLYLKDLSGRQIAGPYFSIDPLADSGRSDSFLVIDNNDNVAVIDRGGQLVSTLEGRKFINSAAWYYQEDSMDWAALPQDGSIITYIDADGGRIVYAVPSGDYYDDRGSCGLMDDHFNVLISADEGYTRIQTLGENDILSEVNHDYASRPIWVCTKGSWDRPQIDLYDDDIRKIFKGAALVGDISNGLIPVARGFYYGLIDFEGKWVAKCSKFDLEASD